MVSKDGRVTSVEELKSAIHEALEWGHGYVVDCMIDTDEMVRPMVGRRPAHYQLYADLMGGAL